MPKVIVATILVDADESTDDALALAVVTRLSEFYPDGSGIAVPISVEATVGTVEGLKALSDAAMVGLDGADDASEYGEGALDSAFVMASVLAPARRGEDWDGDLNTL